MRVKTESPEEVCGFVRGIRAELSLPNSGPTSAGPQVDLDWASWAGKARQLPYFLLAALALADSGVKIFMHGAENHTAGRLYTSQALAALGRTVAPSLDHAKDQLVSGNFTYVTLGSISPRLQQIMELRHLLGVRSPLHTVGRKLNIFDAPAQLLAVTHPPYLPVHQQAAVMLGQPRIAIFKGDGGEAERRPHKPCTVYWVENGQSRSEDWHALTPNQTPAKDEAMDLRRLPALWSGSETTPYAIESIIGTMAIVLVLLGRSESQDSAHTLARELWAARKC
jgi:anthranilate phosphoribosyltransferase